MRTHLILSRLRDLFCAAVISPVLLRLVYTENPLFLKPNSLATCNRGNRDRVRGVSLLKGAQSHS